MLKINYFHRCCVCNFANRQRRRSTPKPQIMIRPDMDNILALTETEFFKKLRKGLHDENLHLELRDFMIHIHEVTLPDSFNRAIILDALVVADIEFRILISQKEKEQVSADVIAIIKAAQEFLLHKLEVCKKYNLDLTMTKVDNNTPVSEVNEVKSQKQLVWKRGLSDFNQLCYGLTLGRSFDPDVTVTDVADVLSLAFNISYRRNYLYKTLNNLKERSKKSITSFFDWIVGKMKHEIEGAPEPVDYLESQMSDH